MKINHKLINKSEVAKVIGKNTHYLSVRCGTVANSKFTPQELEKIRDAFDDMFCYLYEVDEVIIEDGKLKGLIL